MIYIILVLTCDAKAESWSLLHILEKHVEIIAIIKYLPQRLNRKAVPENYIANAVGISHS